MKAEVYVGAQFHSSFPSNWSMKYLSVSQDAGSSPWWQGMGSLAALGKEVLSRREANRKMSTNALSCGECLAGLVKGILLRTDGVTRLLPSGKPPSNLPGCQL